MADLLTVTFFSILAAGFLVGIVVGLTGMGGGALMTPALLFLGVGEAATVVTADLTAAAVYKTGGAIVHKREGSPNMRLAMWLMIGSIPMALLGPHLVAWFTDDTEELNHVLVISIGFALLLAAATYALRLYVNLRRVRSGTHVHDDNPAIRIVPTLLVGMLGGLLVGITSVGSGSVIMIALLMLYPGLSAVRLVGTDLVQAVPLVLAAAISNIALHGIDWTILIPLVVGSVPGTILGSMLAPRVPQSFIRRGIVVVLTMSGVALLDKSGWAPLGVEETHPMLIAGIGLVRAGRPAHRLGLPAPAAGAADVRLADHRRAGGPRLPARARGDEEGRPAVGPLAHVDTCGGGGGPPPPSPARMKDEGDRAFTLVKTSLTS